MRKKKIVPLSQPKPNALFQDAFDHNQNIGASAISPNHPTSSFGKAADSATGATMLITQRGHALGEEGSPRTTSRDDEDMRVPIRSIGVALSGAMATVVVILTACGRGPVEPILQPTSPTIKLELFVQGTIQPSEGDYLFVLNTDTGAAPNFQDINASSNEPVGEPTSFEAYGTVPPPFTHWDQAFVYGSNPDGLPNCPPGLINGFSYCYKAVSQNGGQITIKLLPIVLTPNSFTFNPSANGGSGTGNAIVLSLPLACVSIFAGAGSSSCTVPSLVTQVYINLITLDSTGVPQDQLACLSGQPQFAIDVTHTNTQQLVKPNGCTAPTNQDLDITGGFVSVFVPGSSPAPSPSPT